jgi:hypothetical protein
MATRPASKSKAKGSVTAGSTNDVVLLRVGEGRQEHRLPEGATLADLLRAAGAGAGAREMYVDGKPLEESVVPRPGPIVAVVPGPNAGAAMGDWSGVAGAFADSAEFDTMMALVNAEREAESRDTR